MQIKTTIRRLLGQKRARRRRAFRAGAAAVEFAIVVPIFVLLVIGFIELGRALMVQQVLTNASRVGARSAAMVNSTEAEVADAVTDYAAGAAVPATQVEISPNPATANTGQEITVTVSVDFANVSWLPAPWFLNGATLNASSIMRKEGFE
jgi:Flp pilus assembly protein TadG